MNPPKIDMRAGKQLRQEAWGKEVIKITGTTLKRKQVMHFFMKVSSDKYLYKFKIYDGGIVSINGAPRLVGTISGADISDEEFTYDEESLHNFAIRFGNTVKGGTYEEMMYGSETVAEMI
jgi:hypothetical protein